jgi:hypothetical protein
VTAAAVVVVDAGADLAETISRVEDWLRWCTPRTAQGADRLDAGAAAAAAVAGVLRRSSRRVSTLDGAELAAVCVLPGELAATLAALQAAAVEADEPGPPGGRPPTAGSWRPRSATPWTPSLRSRRPGVRSRRPGSGGDPPPGSRRSRPSGQKGLDRRPGPEDVDLGVGRRLADRSHERGSAPPPAGRQPPPEPGSFPGAAPPSPGADGGWQIDHHDGVGSLEPRSWNVVGAEVPVEDPPGAGGQLPLPDGPLPRRGRPQVGVPEHVLAGRLAATTGGRSRPRPVAWASIARGGGGGGSPPRSAGRWRRDRMGGVERVVALGSRRSASRAGAGRRRLTSGRRTRTELPSHRGPGPPPSSAARSPAALRCGFRRTTTGGAPEPSANYALAGRRGVLPGMQRSVRGCGQSASPAGTTHWVRWPVTSAIRSKSLS